MINQQLITIAENADKIYKAGYAAGYEASGGGSSANEADILKYVGPNGSLQSLFAQANFGGKDQIRVEVPNPPTGLTSMFGRTQGVKKIIFIVPTNKQYSAATFIYGHSSMTSDLEELIIPDGIKFTNFNGFARYDGNLVKIGFLKEDGTEGENGIDLSAVTDTTNCFLSCNKLQEIRFVPDSITKTISFASSAKLSDNSISSIIQGLSKDASGQTLTLHSSVGTKAQAEFEDRNLSGWTLSY